MFFVVPCYWNVFFKMSTVCFLYIKTLSSLWGYIICFSVSHSVDFGFVFDFIQMLDRNWTPCFWSDWLKVSFALLWLATVITLCWVVQSFENRFTRSKIDRLVNNCCIANVPCTRFKKKQVDYFFSFPGNRLEGTPRERGRLFRN